MIIVKITPESKPILEAMLEQALTVETYKEIHYVFPENGKSPYMVTRTMAENFMAANNMTPTVLNIWKD